jgi:hypothetical protein
MLTAHASPFHCVESVNGFELLWPAPLSSLMDSAVPFAFESMSSKVHRFDSVRQQSECAPSPMSTAPAFLTFFRTNLTACPSQFDRQNAHFKVISHLSLRAFLSLKDIRSLLVRSISVAGSPSRPIATDSASVSSALVRPSFRVFLPFALLSVRYSSLSTLEPALTCRSVYGSLVVHLLYRLSSLSPFASYSLSLSLSLSLSWRSRTLLFDGAPRKRFRRPPPHRHTHLRAVPQSRLLSAGPAVRGSTHLLSSTHTVTCRLRLTFSLSLSHFQWLCIKSTNPFLH